MAMLIPPSAPVGADATTGEALRTLSERVAVLEVRVAQLDAAPVTDGTTEASTGENAKSKTAAKSA